MTAKIGIVDIMTVLHSRLWKHRRERFVSLNYDDYREAMLASGLISTNVTIKAKWTMMGGCTDFFGVQANRTILAVDLNAVRYELYSRGIIDSADGACTHAHAHTHVCGEEASE